LNQDSHVYHKFDRMDSLLGQRYARIHAGIIGAVVGLIVLPTKVVVQNLATRIPGELAFLLISSLILAAGFGLAFASALLIRSILGEYIASMIWRGILFGFVGGLVLCGGNNTLVAGHHAKHLSTRPLGWIVALTAIYSGARGYWVVMLLTGILAAILLLQKRDKADDGQNPD
jgi:hypothetical protein